MEGERKTRENENSGNNLEKMERLRHGELEEKQRRFCETDVGIGTQEVGPPHYVDHGAQTKWEPRVKMRRERVRMVRMRLWERAGGMDCWEYGICQ